MTKYFEDFPNVKAIYITPGTYIHYLQPGKTVQFKYQKLNSFESETYTVYIVKVDGTHFEGFCKERDDYRKFCKDNVSGGIYAAKPFLTHKPVPATATARYEVFDSIDGLSTQENLAIAKLREPDKDWRIEGNTVCCGAKPKEHLKFFINEDEGPGTIDISVAGKLVCRVYDDNSFNNYFKDGGCSADDVTYEASLKMLQHLKNSLESQ